MSHFVSLATQDVKSGFPINLIRDHAKKHSKELKNSIKRHKAEIATLEAAIQDIEKFLSENPEET